MGEEAPDTATAKPKSATDNSKTANGNSHGDVDERTVEGDPDRIRRGATGGNAFARPEELVARAQQAIDAQKASGDTELVHGLCQLFGNGKVDHATWCKLDKLAIGQGTLCHGNRRQATALLLGIARSVVGDVEVENKPGEFVAILRRGDRFPALTAAWLRKGGA